MKNHGRFTHTECPAWVFQLTSDSNMPRRGSGLQNGYSLVELMLGMVLSLFMTAAVATGYIATKRTYQLTQEVSRIQENSRFAIHFLKSAIRNSGNLGCVDDIRNHINSKLYDFSKPVMGWNYTGTSSGSTFTIKDDNSPSHSTNAALSKWSQVNGASQTLPKLLKNKVMPGSDVILLQALQPQDEIGVAQRNALDKSTISAQNNHHIPKGSIIVISDCLQASDRYQTSSISSTNSLDREAKRAVPGNIKLSGGGIWSRKYGPESTIYQDLSAFYYIGKGGSGRPSLFKLPIGVAGSAKAVELVEGVENMQIIFGEDLNGDGVIDTYVSADEIQVWKNVISVRVGLLMRSIGDFATDIAHIEPYILTDSISIASGTSSDRVLRYAINSTINLRNSALFRDIKTCAAKPDSISC